MKIKSKIYFVGLLIILFCGSTLAGTLSIDGIPVTTKSSKAKDLMLKGRDALEMGNILESQAYCKKAISEDAHFAYAYVVLANASNSTQEFKDNMEMANQNASYCSKAEQMLIKIGLSYFITNLEDRLALAYKLVQMVPNSPRTWIYLSGIQTENNEIEKARQNLEKAIALDKDFHYAYQQLGFSYLNQEPNDFNRAIQNMKQAVKLVPESGLAYINLGDAYRGNSDLKMAQQNYSKAIEINSEHALAYLKRAHANLFLADIAGARMDYQKAVQLAEEVNLPIYSNYKAFTQIHEGKPMEAYLELKLVLDKIEHLKLTESQKLGQKIFTLQNMVRICIHNEEYDKAKECLSMFSQNVKKRLAHIKSERYSLGQKASIKLHEIYLLAQKGEFNQAHEKCREVKEIYTKLDNEILMENFYGAQAFVFLKEKKYDDAIVNYQKSDMNEIYNKYYLAMAFEKTGEKDKAKKLFKEVADFNFNSVEYALLRKDAMKKIKSH